MGKTDKEEGKVESDEEGEKGEKKEGLGSKKR